MTLELPDVLLGEHRMARDLRELSFDLVRDAAAARPRVIRRQAGCRTCLGLSGPVLDMADLLRGRTFTVASSLRDGVLELRQYSSTRHGDDLDTVPPMDAITILDRMAKAEEFLLRHAPGDHETVGTGLRGHVTIAKRRVARRHGYQRLRLHPTAPAVVQRDRAFLRRHGASRAALLELDNPAALTLGEFRGGLVAVIPERPRRAFEIVLYFRPAAQGTLHGLEGNQRWGLAQALRELTGALRLELVRRGLPEDHRWCLHGGPGADLWVGLSASRAGTPGDGPRDWCHALRSHLGLA